MIDQSVSNTAGTPPPPKVVAVVGGTGFVGRRLVARLVENGVHVRVVARHHNRAGDARTSRITGSLTDRRLPRRIVDGASAIVNLVGTTAARDAGAFYALHCEGPARLALAAAEAGVERLVHFSAMGASADAPALADRSKAAGEAAVLAAFPNATIVRPALVFGGGDHFFSRFESIARHAPAVPLVCGGQTRFEPIFVDDLVEVVARILDDDRSRGAAYDVGNGEIRTLRSLLESVCAMVGRRPPLVSVPLTLSLLAAFAFERLPGTPLTVDQVHLLETDKVSSGTARRPADLGLMPERLLGIDAWLARRIQREARAATA